MARSEAIPFDLRTLDIFLAVCDLGSMAGAARQLSLTQPAVSQAIAELEGRIGAILFDRSVRPLGLTPAGGVLRQRASALLTEAREIAPALRDTARSRYPLLRVGLVDSLSRALAAPLGAHLMAEADEVSVLAGLTASHASALLTRQLDLLLGADDLEEVEGLERLPIVTEPYILLAPRGTPRPARLEDLVALAQRLPFVRYSARSKTGIEVERHLRRVKLDLPRRLEFDTPQGVTAVVLRGEGFALSTPLCCYEAQAPADGLACWPLPGPAAVRRLVLVARRQELGRLPREVAAFCRSELEALACPALRAAMPWLGPALNVDG